MSSSGNRFEKSDWVTWKRLDTDRSVMLDMNSGNYYTLNDTATAVWELLGGRMPVDEVVSQVTRMFDVDYHKASQDVNELVCFFTEKGFLRTSQLADMKPLPENSLSDTVRKNYNKPSVEEHEAVQEIAAAGTGDSGYTYSGYGGGSHYWYPN